VEKIDLSWLPEAPPVAVSLPLLNRMGAENGMHEPLGCGEDRVMIYQLSSWATKACLGKINSLH